MLDHVAKSGAWLELVSTDPSVRSFILVVSDGSRCLGVVTETIDLTYIALTGGPERALERAEWEARRKFSNAPEPRRSKKQERA